VVRGLGLFTSRDEVWAKLEAGTQEYMDRVNRPACPLEKILANILFTAASGHSSSKACFRPWGSWGRQPAKSKPTSSASRN
jgi:hypothetical protein